MMQRRSLAVHTALLLLAGALSLGCLHPPEGQPQAGGASTPAATGAAQPAVDSGGFYDPTWADCSGKDGKGGVKLSVVSSEGKDKLPLVKSDFDRKKRGDESTSKQPNWQVFYGPGDQSLAVDFIWVTKPDDKFWGNTWAGAGLAFNTSWAAVDATDARYLVLWAKTNTPGADLAVGLQSLLKGKGKDGTGRLNLSEFAPGKRLDETWRRIVIPLNAFPEIEQVDLKGTQQLVMNTVGGTYPENKKVTVYLDNVYFSNLEMVTPVSNPGYLVRGDGVLLQWDKDPAEKVKQFAISVNGKPVLTADPKARSVLVPKASFGPGQAVIGIATVGTKETSDEQKLKVDPKPAAALKATVRLAAPTHDISPYILGINFGPASAVKDLGVTVRRWGGNRTTKYNWKPDVDSAGVDWFFLNDYSKPAGTPEEKKKYYEFIKETLAGGSQVNFCIPISEWIAKPNPDEKQRYCSFPTSQYPEQEKTDGQGCGNGKKPNGETIWDNDPNLSMVKNSPELQREFVQTVVKLFGPAAKRGVKFYSMDNEPGLWMHTHRDTVPRGISAEKLGDLNLQYAKAVKAADPTAKVIGFGAWGMLELAGSNEDYLPPGADGHKRQKENVKESDKWREKKRHGGDSQLIYLLKRFKQAEAEQGKRLIDVVDIHWYPELYGKNSKGEKHRVMDDVPYDKVFAPLQWQSLREWYDSNFKPTAELESWAAGDNASFLWGPYHPVIPALKKLLDTYYPGTKLAINEYDNGSPEQYQGALLRAAALGIFLQEDLYMAQNWHQTDHKKFVYWAQKLYGNYDGKGSRVAGKFVPSQSSSPDLLSYAATDRGKWTIVLINKNPAQRIEATIELPGGAGAYRTYTLSETLGLRLLESQGKAQGKRLSLLIPPYAALLVTTK
jgi:hypothetical protein